MSDTIDMLESLLSFVRSLIRAQPCVCSVTDQGLQRCKRCLLLGDRK